MLSRRTKFAVARRLLPVVSRFRPEATARWAAATWMTVPRVRRRLDESPPGGHVRRVLAGASDVAVTCWGDGPTVYLVHGWAGWRGQLGLLVEPFVTAGFRVVTIDAPGHGDSGPGRFGAGKATLVDFVDVLTDVTRELGPATAVVGHSMGGSAAGLAVSQGLDAQALVMLNGAPDPLGQLTLFSRFLRLGPEIQDRMIAQLERLVDRRMTDFDLRRRAAPSVPTLIVHDVDDRQVRYAEAVELATAWPSAQLVTTAGHGHQELLRDPDVIEAVVRFVVRSVGSPRSLEPAG